MEARPLGKTGHDSSVLTFGTFALQFLSQSDANDLTAEVLDAGVNHFDVAPTYGDAESKLAPTLADRRDEIFLGCKTQKRTYDGALEELEASLDRLGVDRFDLYQFHAVTDDAELDAICAEDGALEAFGDAREEGLVDHIGLTSHGHPRIIRDAIERIDDLATVMFPLNYTLVAKDAPEYDYESVLNLARERDLGTIGIKAFAKRPWPDDVPKDDRPYGTWYEPYDSPDELAECLQFALSQGLTTVASAGDPRLVADILAAASTIEELSETERDRLLDAGRDGDSPVPTS